jgi:hypothetical protein
MAISKKPIPAGAPVRAVERFIEAPLEGANNRAIEEKGIQITLQMSKEQLERIAKMA